MSSTQRFSGYPRAREGPVLKTTANEQSEDSNPVLRGWPLVIVANILTRSATVSKAIWTNAKFGSAKDIKDLAEHDWRLSTTVTPLFADGQGPAKPEIPSELCLPQPSGSQGRFYSAADYHELYRSGKTTPVQVVKALFPHITRKREAEGKYALAFSVVQEELVMRAAKASTERYASGTSLGILDGVPFGVKDDIEVEGYISYNGLRPPQIKSVFSPQSITSWPIAQLEAAGAVVIGKLAMHELGSDVSGCNPRWGSPKNWYNTSYYTGGSSSGGGSALSGGIIPIAIGTDAGGSIRVPSSFCGMYGLKPTLHRICTKKSSICAVGPMAATVNDLIIAYRVMSTPNPEDPVQGAFAPSIPPSPRAKKTIGICHEWFDSASPAVLDVARKAVSYFTERLGYDIVDITIPYLREGQLAHNGWALTETLDHLRDSIPDPSKYLSMVNHCNQVLLSLASLTTGVDLIKYGQLRNLIMEHLAYLYKKYPGLLIVTPTVPEAGCKVHPGDEAYGFSDGNSSIRYMMYVWLANSTGCPAITAPVGYVDSEQGEGRLPLGLMAMGEWGAEEHLLVWAKEAEEYLTNAWDGGRGKPKEWADVLSLARAVD